MQHAVRSLLLSLALVAASIPPSVARTIPFALRADSNSTAVLPANSTTHPLLFSVCPSELGFPSNLECATYSVPINWDEPDGEHFDLGLVRLPAPANSTTKVGSLFINPGGPGVSATSTVAGLAAGILDLPELFNAFDIIGLDPRGVGLSHQVECDQDIGAERVSFLPESQEAYDKLVDKNRRYGESCLKRTGSLLGFLDTINAVKDHEAVRIALGNEPINFLGLSYGTQLGSQYASLFPNNIRTLALDGMLQHSQADAANMLIESTGYSAGLKNFFTWAGTNETSPLRGQNVEELWISLIANASVRPIPAPQCDGTACRTDVNGEEILFNAQGALLSASPDPAPTLSTWGSLARALFNATQGDASALSTRFDSNITISGTAIGCLDWNHDPSIFDLGYVKAKKKMGDRLLPLTHGASQSVSLVHSCIGWPMAATNPPKKLDIVTQTTILTVGSDADPSTGYAWAVGALEEFKNKVFVTRIGDGHVSFGLQGETARVITQYLVTGKPPRNGLFLNS